MHAWDSGRILDSSWLASEGSAVAVEEAFENEVSRCPIQFGCKALYSGSPKFPPASAKGWGSHSSGSNWTKEPGSIPTRFQDRRYIEVGTNYVNEIGWDEERPYNSMGAVAAETSKLCQDKSGQKWAGVFLPRVRAVAKAAHNIGYGFGDDLADMAAVFEETAAAFEAKRSKRSW